MEFSDVPPPPYQPPSLSDQGSLLRSDSLTQSATNIFSKALTNVGFSNEKPYRVNDTETLCSICLDAMDEEEGNLYTIPACSHTFHKNCIAKWKELSRKCPCCRGELPDEIGPTHSAIKNIPAEEDVYDMNGNAVCRNVIFCAVGVVYPIFLVSFLLTLESLVFCIFVVLIFWMAIYQVWQEESNIVSIICIIIIICVMFPLLVCCMGLCFVLQILYILFRTLKFYMMVLMCKIPWSGAYNYIIKRTVSVTNYLFEHLL